MTDIYIKLQECIDIKRILKDEPMSKHTSFKIGGNADYLIKVVSIEELKFLIGLAKENGIPTQIVGNGTNLLVLDKGIRGFVIKLELDNCIIDKTEKYTYITVGAGYLTSKLSQIALKESLEGLEFLTGIPGTIGGAIRMNAGAYGREMKDIVISSKYMDYYGNIYEINIEEHNFEYRNSVFSKKNVIILETKIKLDYGNKEEISLKMQEYTKLRLEKQPLEYPNAGSTFKRKEGIITAKLIDDCGLKGFKIRRSKNFRQTCWIYN